MINPVTSGRVLRQSDETDEMDPVSEAELEAVQATVARGGARLADLLIVLAWTGLRWAEARLLRWAEARLLRVADVVDVPTPAGWSAGHKSEGEAVMSTRAGPRAGPLANRVRPMVRDMRVRKVR
ncbi:hypothetical protein [Terrabacter sp. Soil810]|uniref:hypothetical protein n=1 Tax=Terrabacter sp. Soil810 TaxID=1736418 RepID=UPI001F28FBA9|nr:hypothetical protein [Terrabacter sp. Soil810]